MLDIRIPFPSLKNSQKAILKSMATNGPGYGYEIYKRFRKSKEFRLRLSDKTVYIELKRLKDEGFVETVGENPSKRKKRKKGRPAETRYSLTLLGLAYALSTTDANSFSRVGPALERWGSLAPKLQSIWKAIGGKDWIFEQNLSKSFGNLVASCCMGSYFVPLDLSEDVVIFDLIYHFYDKDLRPPFFGPAIYYHFQPIFLKCPEFKVKVESFAKILWLDSKWRSFLLLEQRRTLFEQPTVNEAVDLLPEYIKEEKKLGTKDIYHELEVAIAEWPLSFRQFLKLKVLHEIWLIKEGELTLELRMEA